MAKIVYYGVGTSENDARNNAMYHTGNAFPKGWKIMYAVWRVSELGGVAGTPSISWYVWGQYRAWPPYEDKWIHLKTYSEPIGSGYTTFYQWSNTTMPGGSALDTSFERLWRVIFRFNDLIASTDFTLGSPTNVPKCLPGTSTAKATKSTTGTVGTSGTDKAL